MVLLQTSKKIKRLGTSGMVKSCLLDDSYVYKNLMLVINGTNLMLVIELLIQEH